MAGTSIILARTFVREEEAISSDDNATEQTPSLADTEPLASAGGHISAHGASVVKAPDMLELPRPLACALLPEVACSGRDDAGSSTRQEVPVIFLPNAAEGDLARDAVIVSVAGRFAVLGALASSLILFRGRHRVRRLPRTVRVPPMT